MSNLKVTVDGNQTIAITAPLGSNGEEVSIATVTIDTSCQKPVVKLVVDNGDSSNMPSEPNSYKVRIELEGSGNWDLIRPDAEHIVARSNVDVLEGQNDG